MTTNYKKSVLTAFDKLLQNENAMCVFNAIATGILKVEIKEDDNNKVFLLLKINDNGEQIMPSFLNKKYKFEGYDMVYQIT